MVRTTPSDMQVLRRADLLGMGMRPKQITRAVRGGHILRVRRDRYMLAPVAGVERAVRVGGRLACVSVLALLGVFVFDASRVHIHLERSMSRLRSPADSSRALASSDRAGVALHWHRLRSDGQSLALVAVADALGQAVRCQDARSAVATVDSILHLGVMSHAEVRDVFSTLPARYGAVLRLIDPRSESGTESLMRLILRQLGLRFEVQVVLDDVGRVDFVVEGWLIVECDSKAHHEGWAKQREDRRRDLAAARLGFVTIRPLAEDLLHNREFVVRAVRGLIAAHRRRR